MLMRQSVQAKVLFIKQFNVLQSYGQCSPMWPQINDKNSCDKCHHWLSWILLLKSHFLSAITQIFVTLKITLLSCIEEHATSLLLYNIAYFTPRLAPNAIVFLILVKYFFWLFTFTGIICYSLVKDKHSLIWSLDCLIVPKATLNVSVLAGVSSAIFFVPGLLLFIPGGIWLLQFEYLNVICSH